MRVLPVLLAALLAGCSSPAPRPPDPPSLMRDFLAARFPAHEGRLVVLRYARLGGLFYDGPEEDGPVPPDEGWTYFDELEGLRRETYDDFYRRNREPRDWTGELEGVVLLPEEELEALKGADDMDAWWKRFHAKHPGAPGFVRLAVGFGPDGRQALVYCGNSRGPLAGEGDYYLVEWTGGGWRIADEFNAWVS